MTTQTLGRPDIEGQSPRSRRRLRHNRIVRVLLALLAFSLVVALVWAIWFSPLFAVTSVRVDGVQGAPAAAVLNAAAVPMGVPMARLDAAAAEAGVRALTWVESVEVRRGWPHEVVLAVQPRTAIAVVKGTSRAIDAAGVVFDSTVPAGGLISIDARGTGLPAAAEVLGSLPERIKAKVISISATTRDDVSLTLRGGDLVRWGSAEQPERKAEVLLALMRRKATMYDVSAPEVPTSFKPR